MANLGKLRRYYTIEDGVAVTNTTTATTTLSLDIPADYIVAGSSIRITGVATATTTNSTDTCAVTIKVGSVVYCTTGAVDVADNDDAIVEAVVFVQSAGSSAEMHGAGIGGWTTNTAVTKTGVCDSTAVSTAAAITVAMQITWSVASASNSALGKALNVEIVPPMAA